MYQVSIRIFDQNKECAIKHEFFKTEKMARLYFENVKENYSEENDITIVLSKLNKRVKIIDSFITLNGKAVNYD